MRPCVFAVQTGRKFARKGGPPGVSAFGPDGVVQAQVAGEAGSSSSAELRRSASLPRPPMYGEHSHHSNAGSTSQPQSYRGQRDEDERAYDSPPLALVAAAAHKAQANGGPTHRRAGEYSTPSASLLNRKRPRTTPPAIDTSQPEPEEQDLEEEEEEEEGADRGGDESAAMVAEGESAQKTDGSGNVLLSSSLHNPSDALRMLAHASVLKASARGGHGERVGKGWADWPPVRRGLLTKGEAEQLLRM